MDAQNPKPQTMNILRQLNGIPFAEVLEILEEARIVTQHLKDAHERAGVINL